MTAIAAVIALSTPATSQTVTPADDGTASPAILTSPVLSPVDDTVASGPAPTVAGTPAAGAVAITPPPINPAILEDNNQTAEVPAAPVREATKKPAPKAQAPEQAPKTSAPAPTAAPAPAQTVDEAPVEAVEADAPPATTPALAATVPPADDTSSQVADDQAVESTDWLIPGAMALGLAAIAGGAFAMRRRRKSDEPLTETDAEREPMAAAEMGPAMPPARSGFVPSVQHPAGASAPEGFDMSRYGRHVQAAYAGPTPDNPSMSLRRRLKRARFFDQRERMASNSASVFRQPGGQMGTPRTVPQPQTKVTFEPVG